MNTEPELSREEVPFEPEELYCVLDHFEAKVGPRRFNRINGKLIEVPPCLYLSIVENPTYVWAAYGEAILTRKSEDAVYRVQEVRVIYARIGKHMTVTHEAK